jgi:uncharacterized protein
LTDLAIVAVAFILAGMVKGVLGMGLPTVAMSILGLVMPMVQAAALLVIPSLATNLWQLAAGPNFKALITRFGTMMLAVCVGTLSAIGLLTAGSGVIASAILGVVLVIYGTIGLAAIRFVVPRRAEWWCSPLVGLITGVLTGATGMFVIPAVPYFGALDLEREELIGLLGLSFTVSTVALAAGLLATGAFQLTLAATSLLALVAAFGGMFLGQRIRERLRPAAFRRWFFVWMVLIGLYMVVSAALRWWG